jgi:purine-binding chemotaxis protein CheW
VEVCVAKLTSKEKKAESNKKPSKAKSKALGAKAEKSTKLTAPTEADFLIGREEGAEKEDSRYVVAFQLNGELFAVDVGYVEAVINFREVAELPHTPDFIEGLVSVRGEMVLVMNLKSRLGLPKTANAAGNILVTESLDHEIGIIVDKMAGVMEVPIELDKLPKSAKGKIDSVRFLKGLVKETAQEVKVLDMEALMDFELPAEVIS